MTTEHTPGADDGTARDHTSGDHTTGDDAGRDDPSIPTSAHDGEPGGVGPRLVPWTHRDTTAAAVPPPSSPSESRNDSNHDDDGHDDEPAERTGRRRLAIVGGVVAGVAVVAVVVSAVLFATDVTPFAAGSTTESARPTTVARTSPPTPSATPTPTPTPTGPATPSPRAATPPPQEAAVPAPFVTPVTAGTVVAEGDVASPKGSIHFHYRVVANGDDTYATEWSNVTSSLPVTIGVGFFATPPSVGDGLTDQGEGAFDLGGATTVPTSSSWTLGQVSQPSYLGSLVVSTSSAAADVPVEIGVGKVLAVAPVSWSVPPRPTNIVTVDGGAADFASGPITATTSAGGPKRYQVAAGDLIDAVAQRFGVSVSALIYMNQGLQVIDDQQHLFEGTTLVVDPDSI